MNLPMCVGVSGRGLGSLKHMVLGSIVGFIGMEKKIYREGSPLRHLTIFWEINLSPIEYRVRGYSGKKKEKKEDEFK